MSSLTAEMSGGPNRHHGQHFTFHLTSSAEFELSYRTLRDDAFEVDNGGIISASRLVQGSNRRWNIEVDPFNHGRAVTVTLPVRECDERGAICAGDVKLADAASLTVAP